MSKEIIEYIISDLESKGLVKWPNKNSKINREKLIECWSEYREEADWKWFGYVSNTSTSRIFKQIFFKAQKNNSQSWKNYILNLYGYKYCLQCKILKLLEDFSNCNIRFDNKQDKCKNCVNNYYQNNKEHKKIYNKEHYKNNKEYYKEIHKNYYENNKEIFRTKDSKYRAAKLQRIPSWFTEEHKLKIVEIYKERERLTKETGILHHVDHDIPLQGELVSGLHIPENLRIIPAKENLSKGNKFDV